MTKITLTEEQARLVREEANQMIVLDPQGNLLGFWELPLTPERITMLKRRAKEGPFISFDEVIEHLKAGLPKEEGKLNRPVPEPLSGAA
jgi:hypothetical protein